MAKRLAGVNPTPSTWLRTGLAPLRFERLVEPMTGKDKAKEERLAAALRENLRRRKAQARDAETQKNEPTQPASE